MPLTDCSNNVPDVYKWGQVARIIDLEPNMRENYRSQLMTFKEHPSIR